VNHCKVLLFSIFLSLDLLALSSQADWPMPGQNPERTSRSSAPADEVAGNLKPLWYTVIEPYVPPRFQIIAANNTLYISTAKGLVAVHADTGTPKWVYATEMPLGQSPTLVGNVAYVGGLDHKVYAIQDNGGSCTLLWSFEVGVSYPPDSGELPAGFDTNPLVIPDNAGELTVYLGNRNGYFYALRAGDGAFKWRYRTDGPIHFSAAQKGDAIYFASDDSYAYALHRDGSFFWRSVKLPGAGFHSWWPVVAGDLVIFSGSRNYRNNSAPLGSGMYALTPPNYDPATTPDNVTSVDVTYLSNYLRDNAYTREQFVLDATTGVEKQYPQGYAPLVSCGTHSGNFYPPVVSADGKIWKFNRYSGGRYNNGIAGWSESSPTNVSIGISIVHGKAAWDEPLGYAIGGNIMYFGLSCDRQAGAFDLTDLTAAAYVYFPYNIGSLSGLFPGFDRESLGDDEHYASRVFAGPGKKLSGVYGYHGDQNPPIPYNTRVYMHRSNAILAFSMAGGATGPYVGTISPAAPPTTPPAPDVNALKQALENEILKILSAGPHLRPGIMPHALYVEKINTSTDGDYFVDYFHHPADTFWALSEAYPHLTAATQASLKGYLATEYSQYSPGSYNHIGWAAGAAREAFDTPPEMATPMAGSPKQGLSGLNWEYKGWGTVYDNRWAPYIYYGLWKYAANVLQDQVQAHNIFIATKGRLDNLSYPIDCTNFPEALNALIAGYYGYLQLEKLGGDIANIQDDAVNYGRYVYYRDLRASTFQVNVTAGPDDPSGNGMKNPVQALAVAKNFMFMTPELGTHLRNDAAAWPVVQAAWNEYQTVAPYWFVTRFEATYNEGTFHHLLDYAALFSARAMIFNDPPGQLLRYLDVPGFARGDLFYIKNLSAIIAGAAPVGSPTPTPTQTPYRSPTPSPTITLTRTPTPVVSPTSTPTITITRTMTPYHSPTPTRTRSATRTATPQVSPTSSPTARPYTASATVTPTVTATPLPLKPPSNLRRHR
jgi:hypothetical protein